MMKTTYRTAAAALLGSLTLFACTEGDQGPLGNDLSANDWLLSAENETERFERLQKQLRGFDQPMWEVGERYDSLHAALQSENYELALYHWDKIATTIENGIAKRPGRSDSARALFLDSAFPEVRAGLEQRTPDAAWQAFGIARSACMSCHQAEKVEYMNNQPLFELPTPADQSEAEE